MSRWNEPGKPPASRRMTESVNPSAAAAPWPSTRHTAVGMAAQAGREQRCPARCGRPLALMNELGTIQPYRALGAHAADSVGQSAATPSPPSPGTLHLYRALPARARDDEQQLTELDPAFAAARGR
jgi:hypothetical protein